MNYFDNMRNAYNQAQQLATNTQLTPQQQAEKHKQNAYQEYIQTERGIQSLKLIEDDFNDWYSKKYNINNNQNTDLVETIKKQQAQIDMLLKKIGGDNNG